MHRYVEEAAIDTKINFKNKKVDEKLQSIPMLLVEPGCNAYLRPDLVSEAQEHAWRQRARPDIFLMEFQVSEAILNWPEDGLPMRQGDMVNTFGHVRKRSFNVKRVELLRNRDLGLRCLFSYLSVMGVPSIFHASFAREIHLRACWLANQTAHARRSIIPIVVEIHTRNTCEENSEEEDEEIVAEVVRSSMDVEINYTAPAAKASIETLQKVEMTDVRNFMTKCMVCLEELWMKSEISRMPCSHLYHRDCIVKWLETSHMCPLCRFEMPTALN